MRASTTTRGPHMGAGQTHLLGSTQYGLGKLGEGCRVHNVRMTINRNVTAASAIALIASIFLVACGTTDATVGMASHVTASSPTPMSTERNVTTISGVALNVPWKSLRDVTTLLDTIDAEGNRLVIERGIRPAGSRAAIHIHQYGGHTCVISGEITDFVEGHAAPMVFPAGTCYYMPPNTLMTATNLGTKDAVLIDTFNLPPSAPTTTIREPGDPTP